MFVIYACTDADKNDRILAQVYDVKLIVSDVQDHIPKGLAKDDSIAWVSTYIKTWIKEQVLLHEANIQLTPKQKNKEKQLAEYKKELLLYELEKNIAAKSADTAIGFNDIKKYYNEHRKEFELRKNITRLHYIKLKKDAPGLDKVREWFAASDSATLKKLESYCALYAENYFFNDKVWLSFDDILKEIPLRTYNEEEFLKNNKKTILEDDGFLYLVQIIDFRIKNDVSPIEFEIENIKSILSNKKKHEAVEQEELKMLRKAEANGHIKISK